MNKKEIIQHSHQTSNPVVIEFWAPWCIPCRIMSPTLEKVAQKYSGLVELMRINADDHPQAVKDFGILGIPSIIVISEGQETSRHTGALDLSQLEVLFGAAANRQEILIPPSFPQRILRIGSGLSVMVIGYMWGSALLFYLFGAVLIFSGLYDRCPVFKMLYPKIRSLLFREQ